MAELILQKSIEQLRLRRSNCSQSCRWALEGSAAGMGTRHVTGVTGRTIEEHSTTSEKVMGGNFGEADSGLMKPNGVQSADIRCLVDFVDGTRAYTGGFALTGGRALEKIGYAGSHGLGWFSKENSMAAMVVGSFAVIFLGAILWATRRGTGEHAGH
jgi:hypothetical protein